MRSLVFTPVVAPGSEEVHALTLRDGKMVACGAPCAGFRIALKSLNCDDCKLAVGRRVRPRKSTSKKRKSR